jgi:hypothetical protein
MRQRHEYRNDRFGMQYELELLIWNSKTLTINTWSNICDTLAENYPNS